MSLVEMSPNVHYKSPSSRTGSKCSRDRNEYLSHKKQPPLAVQNMLKSSTETGDVGMFAHRPRRVPRSATQFSIRTSSQTSANSSFSPQDRNPHRLGNDAYVAEHSIRSSSRVFKRTDALASGLNLHPSQSRVRRARHRIHPYSSEHSNSPHFTSQQPRLHSHQSLLSVQSSSAASDYPHWHRRPYKPVRIPSPALSNLYEYRYPSRSIASRHGSYRTDPPSPVSVMSRGRSSQHHRDGYNRSAVFFGSRFSPTKRIRHDARLRGPTRLKGIAHVSAISHSDRAPSTNSLASLPTSLADSIVPFYYDYSESFHGREALLPREEVSAATKAASEQELDALKQIASLTTPSPFGALPESSLHPVELPTMHNRRLSEHSARHSRKVSSRSARSIHVPCHQPIHEDVHHEQSCNYQAAEQDVKSVPESYLGADEFPEPISGRNSTNSLRNWPSPSASTFFTNASRSPRNLSDLAARAHSPCASARVCNNIDAVAAELTPRNNTTFESKQVRTESGEFQLPSLEFRPLSITVSSPLRPVTSPTKVARERFDIVSPKPERPTSSQSRRRFSKILDIDQSQEGIDCDSARFQAEQDESRRLESVQEDSSIPRTPFQTSPGVVNTNRRRAVDSNRDSGCPSSRGRWSGLTSHDKSTVDSLLDRHIECLGLQPEKPTIVDLSVNEQDGNNFEKASRAVRCKPPLAATSQDGIVPHSITDLHRPPSLASSDEKFLVPQRLFASTKNSKQTEFPFASSESGPTFSLCWTDEKDTPSYGWLNLPSDSNTNPEAEKSRQTLMSGEYADIESDRTDEIHKQRRQSDPDLTPLAKTKDCVARSVDVGNDSEQSPCQIWKDKTLVRKESERHRKIKIHLKASCQKAETSATDAWTSTDERMSGTENEVPPLELSDAPVSVLDGLAELSGESATTSQQSLTSTANDRLRKAPNSWSSIAAALPMPPRKPTGVKRKNSVRTIHSEKSNQSVVEPINNSRSDQHRSVRELKLHSNIPQLAHPDLGPAMRASQFDLSLSSDYQASSQNKLISSEPGEALPFNLNGDRLQTMPAQRRFHGFRRMIAPPIRSFTFSPPSSHMKQHQPVSHICRTEHLMSFSEQTALPETVAMSDFAYHRHRLLARLKQWCCRKCHQRPFATKRRKSIPPGGYIV